MQTIWLARHANRQDFVDPDWAKTADRPHDPALSTDGMGQARKLGRRVGTLGKAETLPPSTLADQFDRVQQGHDPCRTPTYPESRHESLARIGATGQCLADRYPDETLLLVGHGMTVLGVLHGLIGQDVPDPGCPLASLTRVVRRENDWHIRLRNDTSHLENGSRAADRLS
ncbi:MAG: histidine phosphatase family protein [Bacteroidetes bacterium QH_2_63_10]|nr:MAG: histidine phosphatase family protein [Bacteroidetes bacterium QH_2_63_10]